MTVPNLITSIRIILVPIFTIYIINDRFLPALIVFMLAGLSDGADGFVARLFDQRSKVGAFLDPLADKTLLVTAFGTLSLRGLVPSWLTVIVISRDFMILLGVLILFLSSTEITIRPSSLSKMTTCFQLLTVFIVLSQRHFHYSLHVNIYVFWVTGVFTIASGLHYMRYWFRMIGEGSLAD